MLICIVAVLVQIEKQKEKEDKIRLEREARDERNAKRLEKKNNKGENYLIKFTKSNLSLKFAC